MKAHNAYEYVLVVSSGSHSFDAMMRLIRAYSAFWQLVLPEAGPSLNNNPFTPRDCLKMTAKYRKKLPTTQLVRCGVFYSCS
jgi:hypothetical protein